MGMTSTQPQQGPTRSCVSCGRTIDWNANVCPYCGHDYRHTLYPAEPHKKGFTGSIVILVVLLILCWPAGLIYLLIKWE